jgi:hypothetical protein
VASLVEGLSGKSSTLTAVPTSGRGDIMELVDVENEFGLWSERTGHSIPGRASTVKHPKCKQRMQTFEVSMEGL